MTLRVELDSLLVDQDAVYCAVFAPRRVTKSSTPTFCVDAVITWQRRDMSTRSRKIENSILLKAGW